MGGTTMKPGFLNKRSGINENHGDCPHEDQHYMYEKKNERNGDLLIRIALYTGILFVAVVAVGGYYYLNHTRTSFNKSISGQSPAPMQAIDIKDSVAGAAPRETTVTSSKPDPIAPAEQDSRYRNIKTDHIGKNQAKTAGTAEVQKTDTPHESQAPLNQLVLKEDNPFREKFIKKFQDIKTTTKLQQQSGNSNEKGRPYLSASSAKKTKSGNNPDLNELNVLPAISVDRYNAREGLKVYGVIKTQDVSIALTNRGELQPGSVVDGDPITGITINEIYLKSGKILKISAQ